MKLSIALLAAPALAFTASRPAAAPRAVAVYDAASNSKIDALASEAVKIFDSKVSSAAGAAPAGDFTPAPGGGGGGGDAGVGDLIKELTSAGAKFADEIKAETTKQ